MIKFPQFRRKFMSWKSSDLKIVRSLAEMQELPMGSVLHILDNFQMDGVSICPRPGNALLGLNKYKLYIKNVIFPEEGPHDVAPLVLNKMIITSAGVMAKLNAYRQAMAPRVMWCNSIRDLPLRPAVQGIVNYNPLFRARVLGMRRKPRFMNMLWAMIINQIVSAPDKIHFIHIPMESLIFTRTDFTRVFKKYDKIATKYPEISTYLFLAHLYSILMKRMDLPKRGVPIEDEEGSNAVEAMDINPADWDPDLEFMSNMNDYMLQTPKSAMETLSLRDSENPYKISIFEYLPAKYFEIVNFVLTCGDKYICYNLRDLKELNQQGAAINRIIGHVNMLTGGGRPTETVETPQNENEEVPEDEIQDEVMVGEDIVSVPEPETVANQPEYAAPMTHEDKLEAAQYDLTELDNIEKIVNKSTKTLAKPLTFAQKQRVEQISRAYKTIRIDGKTIQDILTEAPEFDLQMPEDIKIDAIDQGMVNKRVLISSTKDLDSQYIKSGMMDRDIASVLTSFNTLGMFLVDLKIEDQVDELNEFKSYTCKYEDVEHKQHTIKFQLPKVDEMGRAKVNGVLKVMIKQRVANPICKVRPTRVTLNSNYNKLLVERNENVAHSFSNWFFKALDKAGTAGWKYTLSHKRCKYPNVALPFELTEIGQRYDKLIFNGGLLFFGVVKRGELVPAAYRETVKTLESENGCWFGYKGSEMFFITNTGSVAVRDLKNNEEVFYGAFIDFFEWLTGCTMTPMTEFAELTVLSWKVPVIFALAYRYGLTEMLKYTGADYEIFDVNERYEKLTSDIIIKFSDKKLVVHRNPRNNALLFGGLCIYDLDNISIEDMDEKDVYYELLSQKKVSTNLIKGINSLFDLFIDPITRDVLREMKEPTDLRDLLLRAVTLLTTSEHKEEASASNFRFRGVEQMTGIVYNEMARAFATYKNRGRGATNRFSIKEYQVKQRIAKEQLTENVSIINPLDDIKTYSKFSNAGSGGRSNDTFMISDRQFTKDQIGVVSEATVDNGKVGLNATLPANPIIVNGRGMVQSLDVSQLEPENFLSFNSLLMPACTNDDSKRANFSAIQSSHVVPIAESQVSRYRTGFEGVVAQRTRPPFAYSAEEDGTIVDVDEENKVLKIRYKDGRLHCLTFGEEYTNNSANGFYVNQKIAVNNFKTGDKVKKGDIVAYNKEFFQADPYSKQVNWKIGILAKVALLDNNGTLEDASIITKGLAKKMQFEPVHVREIEITADTHIHSFADVGAKLTSTDPLMIFDESAMDFGENVDEEMAEILGGLNKSAPKADYSGTVVRIEALYKSPLSTMHPTVQKLIKHAVVMKDNRARFAADCDNAKDYQKSQPLFATDKVGIVDLEPGTVLLRFYIKQIKGMDPGDKLFFDNCLKSVVSTVHDEITTEDGEQIEAATSARGILARIISSPFLQGLVNSVLSNTEKKVLEIWNS